MGRALAGTALSWGVVGLVTSAADAPTDVPSPERMLLLGYLKGWTSRKAEHMQKRGMKTITWVLDQSAPYYSSLLDMPALPCKFCFSVHHQKQDLLISPHVCILLSLFKQILCFYYTQMPQSLSNSCPATQGKKKACPTILLLVVFSHCDLHRNISPSKILRHQLDYNFPQEQHKHLQV